MIDLRFTIRSEIAERLAAVDVGWSIATESSIETRTLGVLFAYRVEF